MKRVPFITEEDILRGRDGVDSNSQLDDTTHEKLGFLVDHAAVDPDLATRWSTELLQDGPSEVAEREIDTHYDRVRGALGSSNRRKILLALVAALGLGYATCEIFDEDPKEEEAPTSTYYYDPVTIM